MALRIQTDSPVAVKFPYGDFKEKPNDFNGRRTMQYLYTVEVNGAKDYLYTEKDLHDLLQGAGVRKGSCFTITRTKEGKQVVWKVEPAGASPSSAPSNGDLPGPQGQETPASSGSEALAGGLFGLAARCLRESLRAWRWLGENFTADNVQATANTLFIACSDRGIVLPPVPYPDPEQMEALARIGDALPPDQRARLEKKVAEGFTYVEAQAIIDYYQEKHGQAKKAA